MRPAPAALAALLLLAGGAPARAEEVAASPPRDRAVTIYRAPHRGAGGLSVSDPQGFAMIRETRLVRLPAGESRLRFDGVADGIDPATAIVTGLPNGVVEKNRDARLLSPSTLIALSVGRPVELVRRRPHAGSPERLPGRILSGADGGVVFESAEGVEALRCSGLSETFDFSADTPGLSAQPTLSVRTRARSAVTAVVTLTYLARGFDWSADYVGRLSPDGARLDLGAWLTLVNGGTVGFPDARAQVVAGRLNRRTGRVEPIDRGSPILARCWPQGSTSDVALLAVRAPMDVPPPPPLPLPPTPAPLAQVAEVVVLEALGDLKLYRAPERTTVAARQSKQVRLLDRAGVPVERVHTADLYAAGSQPARPAAVVLRTRDDAAHGLGVPLPSGRIAVFQSRRGVPLLLARSDVRDVAVGEEVEWRLGAASDVQVVQVQEPRAAPPASVRASQTSWSGRVEVSNAGAAPVAFELRLRLPEGARLLSSDQPSHLKDGRPAFRLVIPAGTVTTVRYQVGSAALTSPPAASR